MSDQLQFSIIMPTYERGKVFEESFRAAYIAIQDFDAEIIIVNDSKKQPIQLPEFMPKARVVNNPKSGVASARNLGAKLAKSELLIFVDDDMLITKEAIAYTLKLYLNNFTVCYNPDWVYPPELVEKIAKTQFGRFLIHHGFTTLKGWNAGMEWPADRAFEMELVSSAYLPIYKSAFNKINGYNENFPHSGSEDHDFAKRLKQSGIIAMVDPQFKVWHNEADRVYLNDWLDRKIRSGQTRRMAVNLGHEETKIEHGMVKSAILAFLIKLKTLFRFSLKLIPNVKFLDPLYFKMVNILLAASLWEGYRKQ